MGRASTTFAASKVVPWAVGVVGNVVASFLAAAIVAAVAAVDVGVCIVGSGGGLGARGWLTVDVMVMVGRDLSRCASHVV